MKVPERSTRKDFVIFYHFFDHFGHGADVNFLRKVGARIASVECEPIMVVWGRSAAPSRVQRQSPWSRGRGIS